jgi:hypothetical protein
MAEKSVTVTFPRRDADGRVQHLAELVAASVLGVLVGLGALALIDGVIALLGTGRFGNASGWLATILPALIFFDDLRAWRGYGVRFLVAIVAAGLGVGLGLVSAGAATSIVDGLAPMLSGALGALVAVVVYAVVWFVGIRWLSGRGTVME